MMPIPALDAPAGPRVHPLEKFMRSLDYTPDGFGIRDSRNGVWGLGLRIRETRSFAFGDIPASFVIFCSFLGYGRRGIQFLKGGSNGREERGLPPADWAEDCQKIIIP